MGLELYFLALVELEYQKLPQFQFHILSAESNI